MLVEPYRESETVKSDRMSMAIGYTWQPMALTAKKVADRILERVARTLLEPFRRQGTLQDELRAMGLWGVDDHEGDDQEDIHIVIVLK